MGRGECDCFRAARQAIWRSPRPVITDSCTTASAHMRILIIEDDRRSRDFLCKGLTENAYVCDTAMDGTTGLALAMENPYDLILLDVMLPGLNGWQVVERLRRGGRDTPVLFLTARDTVPDRVKGLELGADDYLVKPFAWAELLARVRTLHRRGSVRQAEVVRVGDLEVDVARMKARRKGRVLDLTSREFQLLSLMARRQGEVLSRATIASEVWGMSCSVESNAMDVTLGRLRKKVDEPGEKRLIHTVRGLGYVMEEREDRNE